MDKYQKVEKAKEATPFGTVRVSATGRVGMYITYAAGLFEGKAAVEADGDKPAEAAIAAIDTITIQASGNALPNAVQVVEILKRRVKGLHQTSTLASAEITDEYMPTAGNEGLEKVTKTKFVSVLEVVLSKKALDTKHSGYQAPIPEDQVEELTVEQLAERGARRKREGGKPKPKKGKGKGAKGKGKGEKGKGKGKEAPKEEEPKKTRGRGGKGAGKGAAPAEEKPARGRGRGRGGSRGA